MANPYLAQLTELLEALDLETSVFAGLECRHFFSGAAVYTSGTICASLSPVGFALKLPPSTCDALFETGRAGPLQYFRAGKVKKGYAVLSSKLAADHDAVRVLFLEAVQHAATT